jgi:MFS family permease
MAEITPQTLRRAVAGRRPRVILLTVVVAAVLADSSVVVLALPDMLRTFSTSVERIVWVITGFNLALALCAVPAAFVSRRIGPRPVFVVGVVTFVAGSLVCGLAGGVTALIAARCVQAVGGGALVGAALELLAEELGERPATDLWTSAAAVGAAFGPAVGGALTQAFDWRAIFFVQLPLGLAALTVARSGAARPPRERLQRPEWSSNTALGLVAGGLTAALFLLVLLMVDGYQLEPLQAAAAVSAIPVGAVLTGLAVKGDRHLLTRGVAGSLLVAGGLAALGMLPHASVWWTIVPQLLIGAGLALAVPALSQLALQRRPLPVQGAWTIAARHAGVVIGLVILTPLLVSDLEAQSKRAEQAGAGIVLESPLSLPAKLKLGQALETRIGAAQTQVPDLAPVFRAQHPSAADRPAYDAVQASLTDQIRRAVTRAFRRAFLVGGLLALAALVPLLIARRGRGLRLPVVAGAAVVAVLPVTAALATGAASYGPSPPPDPCAPRAWGSTGSLQALTNEVALSTLNGVACRLHVPAATLALSLSSDAQLAQFRRRHGISDARLGAAIRAGLHQAVADGQRSGKINGLEAVALNAVLARVPESWLRDQLPNALSYARGSSGGL